MPELHGTFEPRPVHQKERLELFVWSLQADGVGRVCVTDQRHTLPDQRGAAGERGDGLVEGEEDAFKDDRTPISHSTKESLR